MKISEINVALVKEYIRDEYTEGNVLDLIIMPAAKNFISGYTGLTAEEMDGIEDLSIAFLALCTEMYDNRTYTVDESKLNPTVKTILDMHSVNLLGDPHDG